MKTLSILLLAGFILLPWCLAPLFSQNQNDNVEKRIIITRHSTAADGSEVTETTIKKGKAAENFDVDKFVKENQDENTQVEVQVKDYYEGAPFNCVLAGAYPLAEEHGNHAFLGVEPDSDEDADQPGLVVQIVRGSAADDAGLHDNDKIIKINDTAINRWDDLVKFINDAKPGDKVTIAYERNGAAATTGATLITRKDVRREGKTVKGFLGVSSSDEESADNKNGVSISIVKGSAAEKAGLKDGDVITRLNDTPVKDFEDISDFMAYTKPGDKVLVSYMRAGAPMTQELTLDESKVSWNTGDMNIEIPDVNLKDIHIEAPDIQVPHIEMDMKQLQDNMKNLQIDLSNNLKYTVKQKEACLGVYSNDGEASGATIQDFTEESAAVEAGMLKGDKILSVNGTSVNGHSQLWDEIAKYKTGDQVDVAYERDGKSMQVKATLKACRDNLNKVQLFDQGQHPDRKFYVWNWGDDSDRKHLRETRIIIIRKTVEAGDSPKINSNTPQATDRSLNLENFRAFPNPTPGPATIEFKGEAVPTVVSLFDMSGRQLFREELNAFTGEYSQQFDLSAYAKGTIIIHVQQGEKIYTEQIVVN